MQLVRLLVMWGALVTAIPLVMVGMGMPEKLGVLVGMGMVFGGIAHISQSPYWRYLQSKELNPFSKNFGVASIPKPIPTPRSAPKLDTSAKRIWFLVFLSGLLVCLMTFVVYEVDGNYLGFIDAITSHRSRYDWYKASMLIGVVLSAVGYICAFHHEKTVGRLFDWVRNGNEENKR